MKYKLVEQQGNGQPTRWLCSALKISKSGYYSWHRRREGPRQREDRRLLTEIRASFDASHRTYGSPRITKDLRALGYRCSEKRVARIMRQNGIQALPRRKYRRSSNSNHQLPVATNLLERQFTAPEIDRAWVADVTYITTEEGWLYLAVLMDLCSRRIVGWHAARRNDRYLVLNALTTALERRQPAPGLLHHSDQGSPYAAYEYQAALAKAGAVCSMSRRGDCYDNAAVESFFSLLKRERVHRRRYWGRDEATEDIAEYIDFYNRKRRHSHVGDMSPVQFEKCRN